MVHAGGIYYMVLRYLQVPGHFLYQWFVRIYYEAFWVPRLTSAVDQNTEGGSFCSLWSYDTNFDIGNRGIRDFYRITPPCEVMLVKSV